MKRVVLAIGTEWFSRKGGLSTFNRQLCLTLSKLNHKVFCYIPDFTVEEQEDAALYGIVLVRPKAVSGKTEMERMLLRPALPANEEIHIIIGHGLVTGPAMEHVRTMFYPDAKTIFFIHTAPGEIEFLKPENGNLQVAQRAEEKENAQKLLARNATLIAAVGPHLYFEIQNVLSGGNDDFHLVQFDPGLFKPSAEINFAYTSLIPDALLVGRIEDYTLKGVDIAARAMHHIYNHLQIKINGYPVKPRLIIRGSHVGTDIELLKKLDETRTSNLRIQPKNYSPDIEAIAEDVRKAALVLMPSRAEGFGLIALESISNGRPVLISENSGLAMLLRKIAPDESLPFIVPAGIEDNIDGWAAAIESILTDRIRAAAQTKALVEVYSKHINWETSVNKLLESLEAEPSGGVEYVAAKPAAQKKETEEMPIEPGIIRHPDGEFEIRISQNEFFRSRMTAAFPGIRNLYWFNDPKEIVSRLTIFLAEPLTFNRYPGRDDSVGGTKTPIWWFRGGSSLPVKKFSVLSETKVLLDNDELEVEKLAVYRHPSNYREFLYLRTKAERGVDTGEDLEQLVRRQLEYDKHANQEYGIYEGHIITREEYDDGAAIIHGKPKRFESNPELRIRYLTPYNIIIASQSSVYNSREADRLFYDLLNDFLENNKDEDLKNYIEKFMRIDRTDSYGYGIDRAIND